MSSQNGRIIPEPLVHIVFVRPNEDDEGNEFSCCETEQCHFSMKGLDQFKNTAFIDPKEWYLEGVAEDGSFFDINQTKRILDSILQFSCSFDNEGTYQVNVKRRNVKSTVNVPGSFTIRVLPAPQNNDNEGTCGNIQSINKQMRNNVPEFFTSRVLPAPLDYDNEGACENARGRESKVVITESATSIFLPDIFQVIPYLKDKYIEELNGSRVKVHGQSRSKLIGEDGANIENINRILNSEIRLDFDDFELQSDSSSTCIVDISKFTAYQRESIIEILSLYMQGIHYRSQASEFDQEREKWKTKATKAYIIKDYSKSKECKHVKENYSKLMDQAHMQASEAIFEFYNKGRTEKEIDLHGQLVADEKQLNNYKTQLLKKNTCESEVDGIINTERDKMDEAIRLLKSRNVCQKVGGRDWLEIIVGAGHHSRDKRQKIRPKVAKFLRYNHVSLKECNKGSLLIMYKEYSGKEPCCANFYCKKCHNTWESFWSWKGKWQKCIRCGRKNIESECYPLKLRSKSTSQQRKNYKGSSRGDHRSGCQKCLETGTNCRFL